MKKIIFTALQLIIQIMLFAQSAENIEEKKFPNLPVSPSPKAYEMAKYVDFPTVDNYGLVPIYIPILKIKEKDIEHAIELNYHASGIKVAQEATWVGLGWNLKAGGAITRSVRDLADDENEIYEMRRESGTASYSNECGWLTNPDRIENFPNLDMNAYYKDAFETPWNTPNPDADENKALAINALVEGVGLEYAPNSHYRYDCEPDIFYISVNDINLKFVFGFDGQPKILDSNQKVKIIVNQESSGTRIESFEVIDQKGFRYHFGGTYREYTTVSTSFHDIYNRYLETFDYGSYDGFMLLLNSMGECTVEKECITAWYLYEIESPKGNNMYFS